MVTERTLERRRLGLQLPTAPPSRRRRRSARPLVELAGSALVARLRLSAFARACVVAALLLALALTYLVVAAQATQSSYELSRLRNQKAQLEADQDQLRYQSIRLHAPARVEQEAAAAGLQRSSNPTPVAYQPVDLDLARPIGPQPPDASPLWERALAAVWEGGQDVLAAGR